MHLLFFGNILKDLWANLSLPRSPGSRMRKLALDNAGVFDLAGVVLILKSRNGVE
jgi:hypothetical protein